MHDWTDLIDTYVLLGDPALELAVPRMLSHQAYLPLMFREGGAP
jgi:hypothetical protein